MTATVNRYCLACHNDSLSTAGVSFQNIDLSDIGAHGGLPEKILSQLRNRRMPPMEMPKPTDDIYDELVGWLETEIDTLAADKPNPGRTDTFHRLNRAEYANAVRDLLFIEVDVAELLPADDIDAYGFDNMADVLTVSPALMERYLSAARKTARLAVGETPLGPISQTYEVPILLNQADRMSDDLPFGSRGGVAMKHYFPVAGDYDLSLRLHRNYVNYIRGMGSRHEIEVRFDGKLIESFEIGGQEPAVLQAPASYGGNQFGDREWEEYMLFADSNLRLRFDAEAGPHVVGVSFVRRFTETEGVLQPPQSVFAAAVNEMRDGDIPPHPDDAIFHDPEFGGRYSEKSQDALQDERAEAAAAKEAELKNRKYAMSTSFFQGYRGGVLVDQRTGETLCELKMAGNSPCAKAVIDYAFKNINKLRFIKISKNFFGGKIRHARVSTVCSRRSTARRRTS